MSSPEMQQAAANELKHGTVEEALKHGTVEEALRRTLLRLMDDGKIVISRGRALGDPNPVAPPEARSLLEDSHWFGWGREENEERVFFVNVENIRPDARPPWIT